MKDKSASTPHETRGLILAIGSVLCFTATSLLLSQLNAKYGIDGWVASAYRAIIGLLLICVMQGRTGKLRLQNILTNRLLFMRGLIGGATIPMYYICIMEIGPGRAGIITGSYPLFAAVFAMLMLKEGLSRRYFIYIGFAFAGLIAVLGNSGISSDNSIYDLFAVAGAAAAGLCVVMIRHLRHTESTSNIFASQCVFTLLITVSVAGDRLWIRDLTALAITLLAAITVVGGQLCITESFRHINVAKGSTLQMLTPALTVLLSGAILAEQFTKIELMGGAMIIYASYLIVTEKTKKGLASKTDE